MTVEETVTLTGLNVLDGSVYVPGKGLFAITSGTPCKIVKIDDLSDLSTYTSHTFFSDGKRGGAQANCIVYDEDAELLYVVHTAYLGFGGGDNYGIVISTVDPDDITSIGTAADFDTGSENSQGAPALLLIDGALYVLTAPTFENAWLFKIDPSDGSVDDSLQVTGSNRTRGHGFGTDGTRLYFAGNKIGSPKIAWAGWAELDFSAHDTLQLGTGYFTSDEITVIGDYFYANTALEDTPSGTVKKIKTDLSSVTDIQIGYLTGVDGQYYDGNYLWVTSDGDLISGGSQASALVRIDPVSDAVVSYGSFPSGVTKTNEIVALDSDTFVLVTIQQPSKAVRVSLSETASQMVVPKIDVPIGAATVSVAGVVPASVGEETDDATVNVPAAAASTAGAAPTPAISVPIPVTAVSVQAVAPTPAIAVTPPVATASAAGVAPTVTHDQTVFPPVAAVSGAALAPAPAVAVSPPAATATTQAAAPTPSVAPDVPAAHADAAAVAPVPSVAPNVPAATVTVAGLVPSVTRSSSIAPPTATVSVQAYEPIATTGKVVAPGPATVSVTALAPGQSVSVTQVLATGSAAAVTPTPSVAVTPPAGTVSVSGLTPTAGADRNVAPPAATVTTAGLAPTPSVAPAVTAAAMTAAAVTPTPSLKVNVTTATVAVAAFAPTVTRTSNPTVTVPAAAVTVTAKTPGQSLTITQATATVTVDANAPTIQYGPLFFPPGTAGHIDQADVGTHGATRQGVLAGAYRGRIDYSDHEEG